MKKMLVLALVSSFTLAVHATEEKKPEAKKGCGMACCEKNKAASGKGCSDCAKQKTPAPKKG